MKYNELVINRQKPNKRVGRGISAGRGKTAGRGTKGQGSRKSGGVRPGFEGGQMPLYMRLPHSRGFKSHKTPPEIIFTEQLNLIKKSVIDNQMIFDAGLVSSPFAVVKVLLRGEINAKKEVKLQLASKSAIAAIQKSGGTFLKVDRHPRPKKK